MGKLVSRHLVLLAEQLELRLVEVEVGLAD
jgi:hypothetical protein